jgi:5,10-methylene-tetrahydrofolate dehydrogenase/methenyl tetrahydrofolate cyclohydrolase
MTTIMKGAEVAARMKETLERELAALRVRNVSPKLAIVRVGSRPDDLAYERGALKRFDGLGARLKPNICAVYCRRLIASLDVKERLVKKGLKERSLSGIP